MRPIIPLVKVDKALSEVDIVISSVQLLII
jgi:hypothetical protein